MTPTEFKAIRHSLGLSAQGLARALGVSDGRTVRRWEVENGKTKREIPGTIKALLPDILVCPQCRHALIKRGKAKSP